MGIRPLDIESRGRLRARNRWVGRPGFWPILGAAGSLAATALGSYNSATKRPRSASSPSASTPPSPPNTPKKMRSRSRGRSMTRRGARRRSQSRSRSSSGILSRQHDQGGRYQARRRTRGSRSRTRFTQRVLTAQLASQPLQIWSGKGSKLLSSSVNQIGYCGVGLFHTYQTDQPDLKNVFKDAGLDTTVTTNLSSRLYIKSACLDVQIKNTASTEMIVDVYTLLYRKTYGTATYADTESIFNGAFSELTTITAANSYDISMTVFENPTFCQYFKVLKKQEVLVLPGEIVSMQMKYGKDRLIEANKVVSDGAGMPKVTKIFWFMYHGPPDATAGPGSTPAVATSSGVLSWQKVYHYAQAPSPRQVAEIHNA